MLSADGDFFLPINQRADDPLETSGIDITTVDTAIAADNKGYQMMLTMGWGGKGLGRTENGMSPGRITCCQCSVQILASMCGVTTSLCSQQPGVLLYPR